jgi:hypothetical protein
VSSPRAHGDPGAAEHLDELAGEQAREDAERDGVVTASPAASSWMPAAVSANAGTTSPAEIGCS